MYLLAEFWNHSEQHSSKTLEEDKCWWVKFWNHSEQHSSKTTIEITKDKNLFWNHSEQHSSKTIELSFLPEK